MTPDHDVRKSNPAAILLLVSAFLLLACDTDIPMPETGNSTRATTGLGPVHLALVFNERDPHSRLIAEYYSAKRRIPARNIIPVSFDPASHVMRPEVFRQMRDEIEQRLPAGIQAYALAWTAPYRVGCMSVTTAFAAGFDADFCAATCTATRHNPYFDSDSTQPWDDHGWRPAMLLAGSDIEATKALIDRGVAADGTSPAGTGYLVSTSDSARNVRARYYNGILLMQSDRFRLRLVRRNTLRFREDIMFYFTGLANVAGLETNTFRPGAIADHLTSAGGRLLPDGAQMSSLRWLDAGATGSYGAVTEPCNFPQKFPRPDILIDRYLDGETLIEAYWKSVEWPGQGVFIGEPLAAPFRTGAGSP
ncbi:MAG: TIGR03790 family protein [Thiohalobacterales bacterium]|nr:TIGR03790 family protein [Thiohalobacterales bacterium]